MPRLSPLTYTLALVLVCYGLVLFTFGPCLTAIAETFGVPLGRTGLIFTFCSVGLLPSVVLSGFLSERLGKRPVILAGVVLLGAGSALFAASPALGSDPRFAYALAAMVVIGIGAGSMLAIVVLLVVALRGRHRPISAAAVWLIRRGIFRRAFRMRRRRIRQMEDQISRTFNLEGRSAWAAFGCLTAGFATLFVRPLVFFCFLKHPRTFSFPELCLIYVLTQFVLALQITPGSLGAYEGGMIGIFAILGVSEPEALAYVICMRVADALLLCAGLLVAAEQGMKILKLEGQAVGPGGVSEGAPLSAGGRPTAAPADPVPTRTPPPPSPPPRGQVDSG